MSVLVKCDKCYEVKDIALRIHNYTEFVRTSVLRHPNITQFLGFNSVKTCSHLKGIQFITLNS